MATQGWSGIRPDPTLDDVGYANPDPWERVELGGFRLPGVARISGGLGRKLDVKNGSGDGATITDTGYDPARFSIELRMWMEYHLTAWEQVVAQLLKPRGTRPGRRPEPLDIRHPALNVHGIKSAFLERVGILEPAEHGIWTTTLQFLEFMPSKAATASTPTSSKDSLTKRNTSFTPTDPFAGNDPSRNGTALEP